MPVPAVQTMSVTVTVADLNQSAPAEEGQTVLDALLAHGVGFAYSCQAGNCGTCRCELVSGDIVELEYSEHALSAGERSRGIVLACRSQVWSDVVVRRLDAEDFVVHPSRVMRCKVADVTRLTHDILRLRMDVVAGGPFTFSAGQFASLEFPVAPGVVRDYSMANRPDEKQLEFHIRVMPAANSVSGRLAAALRPGDMVRVSGPLGTSYLREQHAGAMLGIAGGSGLAPVKSIVETALQGGFGQPVHLYFGVRAERDVYFEAELAEMQNRFPTFRAHIVLSESGGKSVATLLPRRVGLVTEAVAADFASLAGFKVYFAGPPPMVDAATALVRARGVESRDIHADAFFPAANSSKQMAEAR
ncbi:MAG TPA: 2Fe-2S iron-sulfur cluster-binding protein [Burkholderiales bacterium]